MAGADANDPILVAKLVKLFQRGPSTALIENLDVTLHAQTFGTTTLPVSISDPPNCYICCPSTAYIDYALAETRHFTANPILRRALTLLVSAARPLVRATGLDHQVQPNNWLFSTNPVPALNRGTAETMRDQLVAAHPGRAIVIRSLNDRADSPTMAALKRAGFVLLPARQIYVVDTGVAKAPSADMKRDAALLRQTPYAQIPAHDFTAADWTRAAQLYHMLYIDKYTDLNPQYTAAFLAQAHQIGLLQIIGLRGADDRLDGILGMFVNGRTMTVPLIGYDTSKPQDIGLYRMLNAIAEQRATASGYFYNLSAGAANFKRNRNAVAAIEYTAVYVRHLPAYRRATTAALRMILTRVGVPLMRRYRL